MSAFTSQNSELLRLQAEKRFLFMHVTYRYSKSFTFALLISLSILYKNNIIMTDSLDVKIRISPNYRKIH